MEESKLSDNGILYISTNFPGVYTLQVIACKSLNGEEQLCLTDGRMYIGGRYLAPKPIEIPVYSIVEI